MKLIIGVGLGKAASTSINNYLKKHPEILICSPKEIYHKYLSESGLDINNLNTNFNFNKSSENFKSCFFFFEAFTGGPRNPIGYSIYNNYDSIDYINGIAKILKKIFPQAEILFINREIDDDYIKTNYRHDVLHGSIENEDSYFKKFKNLKLETAQNTFEKYFKVNKLDFSSLKEDKVMFLKDLCKIFDVDYLGEEYFEKLNEGISREELKFHLFLNKFLMNLLKKKIISKKIYLRLINSKRIGKIRKIVKLISF